MALIKIAAKSELPTLGKVKEIFAAGKMLCVSNVDGEIWIMENTCPHWGGPLGQGTIENGKIVCPWHGWQFDPRTGETPRNPNVRLSTKQASIEGEDVFVELG
jgi:nitrite reductase/ring-hydroxylating ferredoxin subunit